MTTRYWLVKQEPDSYSWDQFVADKGTAWTGVRNFQARNYLRAMQRGDRVFYYHSGGGKQVVGIAIVAKEPFADPTASEGDWSAVELRPIKPLKTRVGLSRIKTDTALAGMVLLKNSRLSVQPVTESQAERLLELGGITIS